MSTHTEVIEMADHRQYLTTDGWQTAVLILPSSGRRLKLTGRDLDLARFLAASQASASPNWKRP